MLYHELTTVQDLRATFLDIVGTSDDALLLQMIRSVSADIGKVAGGRTFVPRAETRYFDARRDVVARDPALLVLDEDLLAVTTLTNGDSVEVTSGQYLFESRNVTPYWAIRIKGSSGVWWTYSTDPENAISLLGTWGHDVNGGSAWASVDTLAANATDSATSLTLTTGAVKAGQLLKIGTEFLYVSSCAGTGATVVRGANGSTANAHSNAASVYAWVLDPSLEQLAKEATAARYRLRANPLAETVIALDGTALSTPKDIDAYLKRRLQDLGLVRW